MKSSIVSQFIVALVAAALVFGAYQFLGSSKQNVIIEHVDKSPVISALYTLDENGAPVALDFTGVAERSLGSVVHILSASGVSGTRSRGQSNGGWGDIFGDQQGPRVGSGSGVIVNADGYIVTNNHVVQGAEDLEVTLNDKRKYKAKLVGTDPQTDIAVIKIDEKELPSLKFSNSDDVKIGQWVLAIGNPFNLTSTVTAGIVSAKGRDIALFDRSVGGIESFIQTDAAINPGNSGGALIDLNGNLMGINTAIASQSGTYAGYGFAVPANLASRVVSDLIQYGSTQRGYLGVTIANIDGNFAKQYDLPVNEGAYVSSVVPNSAAQSAGIKEKDVVVSINDRKVGSSSDLMELVGSHRIGDELKVKVNRMGEIKVFTVKLKNQQGTNALSAPPTPSEEVEKSLGATLIPLDNATANRMGLSGGVQVTALKPGLLAESEIEEGFIITKINRKPVTKPSEVIALLRDNAEGVLLEGYYPGYSQKQYYGIGPR